MAQAGKASVASPKASPEHARFEIEGLVLVQARRFQDARGWFQENFRIEALQSLVGDIAFVQDNLALSESAYTLRGLHFQSVPFAQAKLIQVVRGAILDVAVDLRRHSTTFGRAVSVELNQETPHLFFIPPGFAHGYMTLAPDTIVAYRVSGPYQPASEGGLHWQDESVRSLWPVGPDKAIVSEKDANWPMLSRLPWVFGKSAP